jgi:hypothetical protein
LDNNTIVKKSLGLTLKPEPTLEEEEESNQEAPSSSTALQGRTPAKEERQTPKGNRYLWDPAKETCVCIHPSGLVEQANELVDMGGKVAAILQTLPLGKGTTTSLTFLHSCLPPSPLCL